MDLSLAVLAAITLAAAHPVHPATGPILPAPRVRITSAADAVPRDTVIEYPPAYYTRLTIHRWGSYTMLPLFAAQYYVGSQLYSGGEDDSKDLHETLALGVAGLFAINTTTGLWNLWEMRADSNGRARRITHVTLMLLADAGFVATGLLADEAEDGGGGSATTHRAVAIGSMTVATIGWLIQTDLFSRK